MCLPDMKHSSNRELGIELLRLVSMFMIVSQHVLSASGGGGVLRLTEPFSVNWWIAWIWETVALQAVNCFGLVSGYALYDKKWNIKSYFQFWITVFAMNAILYTAMRFLNSHAFNLAEIIWKSIPWNSSLWYVDAYLGLLLIMPAINVIINEWWDRWELYFALAVIILVPLVYKVDYFITSKGYSALWLAVLYIMGGTASSVQRKTLSLPLLFVNSNRNNCHNRSAFYKSHS